MRPIFYGQLLQHAYQLNVDELHWNARHVRQLISKLDDRLKIFNKSPVKMFGEPNSKICFYLHQFHDIIHYFSVYIFTPKSKQARTISALLLAQEESDVCPTLNQEGDVRKRH